MPLTTLSGATSSATAAHAATIAPSPIFTWSRSADLTPQRHALSQSRAPRQSRLAHDHAVRADRNVVADLNEVVDLGSAADARHAEFGAVHADARADLHVVLDDHRADLRNLRLFGPVPAIAEPVAAQHAAGMNDHARADAHALADRDLRENLAILADLGLFAEEDLRMNDRPPPDANARPNHAKRADRHVRADLGRRIDLCLRVISPRRPTAGDAQTTSAPSRSPGRHHPPA